MSSMSNENDACFGTSYVKKRENNNIDTLLCRPRRYKRAYDRAIETSRRHTFYEENFSEQLPIYRSLGHRSIQQASFNKSAAKQCRIIKFQRQNTSSLPNLFSSYNSNLNELDGLNPLCLKKTTKSPLPQFDSFSSSLTVTTRKQRPPSSSSSTPPSQFEKQEPQSSSRNSYTLPKAVNSVFNSIRNYPLPQYLKNLKSEEEDDMKGLTKDKAATTTSGKPKKKRSSIFSFFSRKKHTEPKPHSTLDDNISHGGSELNFDDVVVPKETAIISPPVKSKKTFRAPLPPPDDNKENVKDLSKKRLSNASVPSKFSRQGSRRSSRRSSSRRKAASNSKTIKVEETKSVISNDSAPNDPPPPIPPPLETRIDNNFEEPLQPSPPPMTHLNSNRLKTVIKTETIYPLKKAVEITPSLLETDVDKNLIKEKKKQQSPITVKKTEKPPSPKHVKNDEITTDMIFTSPLPQPSPKSSSSSLKQTKLKQKKEEDFDIPPAIPQSAPPDPIAVATALSFTSTKQSTASSVKRLSNFGLSPAKVPPIPVSQFEDLTDSSSDSGNSTNIIMPVYTNVDLKHQLHIEHKKLLSLYEEWEMLRRPQYSSPNDGLTFANIMTKQEAVLRQHAIVTSLYNQLLAPVVSNNSSPASTLRLKPAPPRHIINPTNSNPPTLSRGYIPSLYKSHSTYDVMNGENNNIKKEPERNYQPAGNYSPRISQTKRYSAGDVLNPIRPRLGSTETSENSNNHRYDERKKYVVEQKSVVRNVPIMTSLPKLMNTNIIINTEPKRNVPQSRNNNFTSYSPPVTKRELTPVNEKPIKKVEVKKENIEIKKPPPQTLSNNVKPKNFSPLVEKKVMKYPSPPNYSPKLNNHQQQQHYYANSPPTTKKQVVANGFHHPNHSPPDRQISLPEVIQKQAAKPPTPIQTKKVIATPKSSPTKTQPQTNNGVHGDLLTSISAFPNVTLRSVPKPVEKSFNLGRVLENGERPSSYYREQEEELPTKSFNGTGPPAPPPPPPPPPPSGATLKKSNAKQASPPTKNSDADALRGDMLAEIRKAGGVQFLRSVSTK